MRHLAPDAIERVLRGQHPAEFLQFYIQELRKTGTFLNYASLARKAGYASRAYVRDIVLGKKPMTPIAFEKISRVLKLSGDLKRYFELLSKFRTPSMNVGDVPLDRLSREIEKARHAIKRRCTQDALKTEKIFWQSHWVKVYAALPCSSPGHDIVTISKMTGLPEMRCFDAINQLLEIGTIKRDGSERFIGTSFHMAFRNLGKNEFFKSVYLETMREIVSSAKAQFETDEALYSQGTFLISKDQLTELKKRLHRVLQSFIDTHHRDRGDQLVHIGCGFQMTGLGLKEKRA